MNPFRSQKKNTAAFIHVTIAKPCNADASIAGHFVKCRIIPDNEKQIREGAFGADSQTGEPMSTEKKRGGALIS
jgi:hypothetical protein